MMILGAGYHRVAGDVAPQRRLQPDRWATTSSWQSGVPTAGGTDFSDKHFFHKVAARNPHQNAISVRGGAALHALHHPRFCVWALLEHVQEPTEIPVIMGANIQTRCISFSHSNASGMAS